MRNHRLYLPGLLALFGCLGCGEVTVSDGQQIEQPDLPTFPLEVLEKVRNGEVTTGRPEVGSIGGCTATLVAPDVAITAAHCVGYRTRTSPGSYMSFRMKKDGVTRRVSVNRYRSFSSSLGEYDIAILGLAEQVPADFAKPAPMARVQPPHGTSLTVYGYGCTQIGARGDGKKRKATYEQGENSYHLCPGDSGGPVFNDETGEVLRINSGYRVDRLRTDIYAQVPSLHADLKAQVEDWSAGELPEAEPLDPNLEICGRNADVFEMWTCTGSRDHRYRCLPGGTPTWEACARGCTSKPAFEDDLCSQGEPEDTCGDTYRPYSEWTCATDNVTLLRCNQNTLELSRCAQGCDYSPFSADACKE